MSELPNILLIDDDVELCELIQDLLAQEGFSVEVANDGQAGLQKALEKPYAMIILDVMLPSLNGFEVLTRLRQSSQIPVVMLTARGEDVDRIVGLEMGADDYLPKPFNPRELVARVRAIHRRATPPPASESASPLHVNDLEIVPSARRVTLGGQEVKLTTAEYDLLDVLVRNAGTVVSREELTRIALGRKLSAFDRAIDMHVSNLRKKLGPSRTGGERIKTVRNTGYILAREGQ